MSDPSRIGSPIAPLPGFPGAATTTDPGAAAAPQGPDAATAEQLAALLGTAPPGAQGAGDPRRPNAYSGAGAASVLPPPRAPATQLTPQTQAHYESLHREVQAALDQAAQAHGQARFPAGPTIDPRQDPEGASSQAVAWLTNIMQGLQKSQGDLMLAFMKLRLHDASAGMQELQDLSDLDTDMQKSLMGQQQQHTKAAQDAATKAQNKAQMMNKVGLGATIAMLVVTAITAVVTFGTSLALLPVAAAAAVGFVAGGLAQSHGKHFDVQGALQGASWGADAAMLALGIGAIMMSLTTAAQAIGEQAAGQVARSVGEAAPGLAGSAARSTLGAASEAATSQAASVALRSGAIQASERAGEGAAQGILRSQAGLARFMEAFKGALSENMAKLGVRSMNRAQVYTLFGLNLVTSAQKLGVAGVQYGVNTQLANVKDEEATVQLLGALADVFKKEYSSTQDIIQYLVQAHSRAVEAAQDMLKNSHQAAMKIATNTGMH